MTVSKTVRRGSSPWRYAKQCSGGREAQCNGLQIRKTVSSNLTRYSKYSRIISADISALGHGGRRKRVLLEQDGKCNKCGIDNWQGKPISLELEHIDGNNKNNDRSNLECLCPNCHAQTSTWRGRNRKSAA